MVPPPALHALRLAPPTVGQVPPTVGQVPPTVGQVPPTVGHAFRRCLSPEVGGSLRPTTSDFASLLGRRVWV